MNGQIRYDAEDPDDQVEPFRVDHGFRHELLAPHADISREPPSHTNSSTIGPSPITEMISIRIPQAREDQRLREARVVAGHQMPPVRLWGLPGRGSAPPDKGAVSLRNPILVLVPPSRRSRDSRKFARAGF